MASHRPCRVSLSCGALFINLFHFQSSIDVLLIFGQILEFLSGSLQICTDSQGGLNMGCCSAVSFANTFGSLFFGRSDSRKCFNNSPTSLLCQFAFRSLDWRFRSLVSRVKICWSGPGMKQGLRFKIESRGFALSDLRPDLALKKEYFGVATRDVMLRTVIQQSVFTQLCVVAGFY